MKRVWSILIATALAGAMVVAQGPLPPAPQGASAVVALPDYQGPGPEQFLKKGKITKVQSLPVGVAGPQKITLVYEGVTHQAVFKSIDIYKPGFTPMGLGGGRGRVPGLVDDRGRCL